MGHPRTDLVLLFSSRALRLFGFGFLSVNLVLFLTGLGLAGATVGLMLSLALLGDVALYLLLPRSAVFPRSSLVGSLAAALGALASGLFISGLLASGMVREQAYRSTIIVYGDRKSTRLNSSHGSISY